MYMCIRTSCNRVKVASWSHPNYIGIHRKVTLDTTGPRYRQRLSISAEIVNRRALFSTRISNDD